MSGSDSNFAAAPALNVERSIYLVRGQKVLVDRDLALLYGTTTRLVNQAVRRNLERFPQDFLIELSRDEITRISQFETSSGLKFAKSAYAFTEQGVAMLSGLLNTPRAIAVNIEIMRAFVRLRQLISTHADLTRKISALEKKYDAQFKSVFDALRSLMDDSIPVSPGREIGFHTRLPGLDSKPKKTPSKHRAPAPAVPDAAD
jgi:ORF6N domain